MKNDGDKRGTERRPERIVKERMKVEVKEYREERTIKQGGKARYSEGVEEEGNEGRSGWREAPRALSLPSPASFTPSGGCRRVEGNHGRQ